MNTINRLIFGIVASCALVSCDPSRTAGSDNWSPAELGSTIEEVWIGDADGKVISLDRWLGSDNRNTLEWISRNDALALHRDAKAKFGVDLGAISESELPHYTVAIVAIIPDGVDRATLKQFLASAASKFQVDVQLGNRWLSLDGLLSDDGEYVPK